MQELQWANSIPPDPQGVVYSSIGGWTALFKTVEYHKMMSGSVLQSSNNVLCCFGKSKFYFFVPDFSCCFLGNMILSPKISSGNTVFMDISGRELFLNKAWDQHCQPHAIVTYINGNQGHIVQRKHAREDKTRTRYVFWPNTLLQRVIWLQVMIPHIH